MTTIWLGVLEQGLLWGVMVLGVYITFRVLDFPDLTVDGSFTLGAAVAARIIFAGYDPWLASGLALGNGLVALSGALVAQYQSYSDVGMGIGMIVVGLASVIVGEVVIGNRTLLQTLVAVVIGSMIYRAVIAIVMQMGLPATDLKLFTAALVVLAMSSPIIKEKLSLRPGLKGGAYRVVNRGD